MEIIDVALRAAERASEILLGYQGRLEKEEIAFKSKNDYVTKADREAEEKIIETIKTYFPDHSIVAEESGTSGNSDYTWYIDPLDGTKNFIHGLPVFSVSIGVAFKGEMIAGVVSIPKLNEVFSAEKGSGAFCNGEKIKVSDRPFNEGLIATGFPFKGKEMLDDYLVCFKEVFFSVSGVRRCGSAAIDLAYTAKGIFDGFWELSLKAWDIAAGVLLIEEAGGTVSDFKGGRDFLRTGNIIGASQSSYKHLFSIVNKYLGGF
ncbi:inositol monophosphatase family protein [Desulfurobacterium sp. TC5-1]|uniref:inositol monophosphatase family protein n=1 Tax=Desulfurobacterium sp. TC5-1 TaxID=1158318 RepID=UPI0003B54819|nr:inositol monophosphatase family protein [Desulfurobacterium sp. TC5-1]